MRKRLLAIVVATFFLLNMFAMTALADTAPGVTVTPDPTTTSTGATNTGAVITPDSGLTPVSPLYGLKVLGEKINLLLTDDPQKQAELYAQYAVERLNEAKLLTNLTDQQKADLLKTLTTQYAENIQKAQDLLKQAVASGANINELVIKLDQAQNITGLNIVLGNMPEGVKNQIRLNLLQNLQTLEDLKLIVEQKGVEIEDENENQALEAILGQSISAFVHSVNDARQEVHKAVVTKPGKKDTRKDLKEIEKQFKNDLKQISKSIKAELVQIAKANTTEAQAKTQLDSLVKKGIDQVKAAKDKALAAINNSSAPQSPDVNVSAGDSVKSVISGSTRVKVEYQKGKKENHRNEREKEQKGNENEDD